VVATSLTTCPELNYADSVIGAATGANVVLLLTDWAEFSALDPVELGTVTASRQIIDGRYMLDPARWRAAGWHYRASGVPAPAQSALLA
jgi:UDPglucose 6-dehydrogenase